MDKGKITVTDDKIYQGNWILEQKMKSKMIIGNLTIFQTKKFNWFNKLMFKIVFGIEIEDIGETYE